MHAPFFDLRLGNRRERLRKGGTLLVFYPVFAIAALISLSGDQGVVAKYFLLGCLAYPVVFAGALIGSAAYRKRRRPIAAFKISAVPLAYLAVVTAVGFIWLFLVEE